MRGPFSFLPAWYRFQANAPEKIEMTRLVVLSGCSGGGKSTLLLELQRRGCICVAEPGRRIGAEELESGGGALPWLDMAAFARRALAMALTDLAAAEGASGPVFFDRSLVDAAAALEHVSGLPILRRVAETRYDDRVFMAPPWPELYRHDAERRHGFDDAVAEYERLLEAYSSLGYRIETLPKAGVAERADFVLERVHSASME
jgi:predicted ATPase